MNTFLGVLLVLSSPIAVSKCSGSLVVSSVPAHLLQCYRRGGPELSAPHRLDVFLQLLRKLESHRSQLDLRLFTTALLRSLRLDGIEQAPNPIETEYLIPYRATAFQFQRYKLLMDLFLPSQNTANIHESLEGDERCLFHKLMSGSVRRWERGDEAAVCPLAMQQHQNVVTEADVTSGRAYSRCPIEEGVIQTEWGTIAPGTVVAAIAAAMEDQSVAMSEVLSTDAFKTNIALGQDSPDFNIETLDMVIAMPRIANAEINNVWVATLAGDLAEVVVNQGPRVGPVTQNISIGSNNRWNDTALPRINYIFPQNVSIVQWHMTEAEILAGIDGLIIAKELRKWTSQMGSLRLSQILEMYYSQNGVSFDPNIRACNRRENFYRVFDQAELLKEMSNFAQILSLSQGTVYVPIEEVDRICKAVVNTFVGYLSDMFTRNQVACGGVVGGASAVDLVLVTDGAWKKYQVEQFVSSVGLQADVSLGRNTLGLLHGNTALWIAPPANNLTRVFGDIQNFTDEWPNRLNFPNVLTTLFQHLNNKTTLEADARASVAPPTVVLVVSTHDRPTTADIERSRQLMNSLRRNYFDVRFAYLAQDLAGFYELNLESEETDWYLQVESTSVEESVKIFTEEVIRSDIPKRIIGVHCAVNGTNHGQIPFEDYVLVQQKKMYRIHPYYMHDQPLITVQFRTMNQGEIQVCSSRDGAEAVLSCQQLGALQTASFNVTCQGNSPCHAVTFTVTGVSSMNMCANIDCRLPSQVGFYLEHQDLRCLSRTSLAPRTTKDAVLILYCSLAYFILLYSEN